MALRQYNLAPACCMLNMFVAIILVNKLLLLVYTLSTQVLKVHALVVNVSEGSGVFFFPPGKVQFVDMVHKHILISKSFQICIPKFQISLQRFRFFTDLQFTPTKLRISLQTIK